MCGACRAAGRICSILQSGQLPLAQQVRVQDLLRGAAGELADLIEATAEGKSKPRPNKGRKEESRALSSGASKASKAKEEESDYVYTYETDSEESEEKEKTAEEIRREKATPATAGDLKKDKERKANKDAKKNPPSRDLLGLQVHPLGTFPSKPTPDGIEERDKKRPKKEAKTPENRERPRRPGGETPAHREPRREERDDDRKPIERKPPSNQKPRRKRRRGSKGAKKRERGQQFKAWREAEKARKRWG